MKNDILFKNIFLTQVSLSSLGRLKENLEEISRNVHVSDGGEWDYKLNTALETFSGVDLVNIDFTQAKKVIDGCYDFVELLEDTDPKDELDLEIIKDFDLLKNKLKIYQQYLKDHTPVTRLDPVTLEALAEFICGDNADRYPIYRSSSLLTNFFQDIDIDVRHDGSTRKLWVLSVLKELSTYDLNKVILRLVDIRIYKGNRENWLRAIESMNDLLFVEDLVLKVNGKNITIIENTSVNVSEKTAEVFKHNTSIINHGIINNAESNTNGDVLLGESKKNISSHNHEPQSKKSWHEKPLGIIFLTVVSGLIIALLVFYLNLS